MHVHGLTNYICIPGCNDHFSPENAEHGGHSLAQAGASAGDEHHLVLVGPGWQHGALLGGEQLGVRSRRHVSPLIATVVVRRRRRHDGWSDSSAAVLSLGKAGG